MNGHTVIDDHVADERASLSIAGSGTPGGTKR
jgi:hypothetical protein